MCRKDFTSLLITSFADHCVRELNIDTLTLNPYIGEPGCQGAVYEGHRSFDIKIKEPFGITSDGIQNIFVGLFKDKKILRADMNTDMVELARSLSFQPAYFNYDVVENSVFLTYWDGFAEMDAGNFELTIFLMNFGSSRMISRPSDFARLDSSTWLIADRNNDR